MFDWVTRWKSIFTRTKPAVCACLRKTPQEDGTKIVIGDERAEVKRDVWMSELNAQVRACMVQIKIAYYLTDVCWHVILFSCIVFRKEIMDSVITRPH